MSKAIELIEYIAGVEAQNAAELQVMDATNEQSAALIAHFAEQATKKTIALAQVRQLMLQELAVAAPAASA